MLKPTLLAIAATVIFALGWWMKYSVPVPLPEFGGLRLLLARVFGVPFWITAALVFSATFFAFKPRTVR